MDLHKLSWASTGNRTTNGSSRLIPTNKDYWVKRHAWLDYGQASLLLSSGETLIYHHQKRV